MPGAAHQQGFQPSAAGCRMPLTCQPAAPLEKTISTACARAALWGIQATPARDDRGRRTVILSAAGGLWVREVGVEQLAEALEEAKRMQELSCTA